MALPLLKAAAPLAVAIALFVHGSSALAGGAPGLTNVAGGAADCVAPARQAVCATLFDGGALLYPGGPAEVRRVRIAYAGDQPAEAVGLYVAGFASRSPKSRPMCQAADPAASFDVTIGEGSTTLFQGTLAELAAGHDAPPSMLALPGRWHGGDGHTYTISVALDRSAGNDLMGCVSTADFVWLAAQ